MSTFDLEWREVGAAELTGSENDVTDEYYEITDLDPDTSYEWRVCTATSGWSEWEPFDTDAAGEEAGPTNVQATALSSSEIRVTWGAVANADGYEVRYRVKD